MATNEKINQLICLTKKHSRTYFEIAISVVLFIQFFQPFTITKFDFENKILFFAGFGLIILICLLIAQLLFQSRLIQAQQDPSENSIYIPLYFFTQVATTTVAFIFYIRYVGQSSITFNTVVKVIIISISLPVTMHLKNKLGSYQERLKKLMQNTRMMQGKIEQFSEKYANKHIELISENESSNFRLLISTIVFAKSADNYVEVGYHSEGVVKKKMLRNRLRNIEQQLGEYNNFIRTHRTSLVNIQYIDKLNKNFNTYWLSLDNTEETVPVSRQYLMVVKDLL